MLQERNGDGPESGSGGGMNTPAAQPAEMDGLTGSRRIWAIVAISFGGSVLMIDSAIANVALPTIARELQVTNSVVTNVVTIYQLVLVMVLLPFANLADRVGHRKLYQIGLSLFVVASALCYFADSFAMLLALRSTQAIGAGMGLSVSAAMIREIYPAKMLGTGMGFNTVILASSGALAPTLGGFIVNHMEWKWVFVAAVPIALVALLLSGLLPNRPPRKAPSEWFSSVWSAGTMLLLIGGLQIATHGWPAIGAVLGILGVVSMVMLIRRERARTAPVIPVDLLANPTLGLTALAGFVAFIAAPTFMLSLPFRFEASMGFSPQTAGLLLAPFPLTILFVGPFAGWLSDRVAPTKLGVAGMSVSIAGLILLATMPTQAAEWDIAWRVAVTGAGFGLFMVPNSRLLIGQSPRNRTAAAGGLLSTTRMLGQTMAAVVVGILLTSDAGLGPMPMIVSGVLCAIAATCSLVRYTKARRTHPISTS